MTLPTGAQVVDSARRALAARGDRRLADTLAGLRLEVDPVPESWSISGRQVMAYRGALLAPQRLLLALRERDADREAIRTAVRAAFDTRERVLREVLVVLDRETLGVPREQEVVTGHPYRIEGRKEPPPSPAVLRAAAETYAHATKDAVCADLLSRAKVLCEPAAPRSADRRSCYRAHVLLDLEDLAAAHRDRTIPTRLAEIFRTVGTSLDHAVGDVTLSPWLDGLRDTAAAVGPARHRIALLADLLAAEGVACVVVGTVNDAVRLVAHCGGQTAILDVAEGAGWRPLTDQVDHVRVGADEADGPELARRVRNLLRRAGKSRGA